MLDTFGLDRDSSGRVIVVEQVAVQDLAAYEGTPLQKFKRNVVLLTLRIDGGIGQGNFVDGRSLLSRQLADCNDSKQEPVAAADYRLLVASSIKHVQEAVDATSETMMSRDGPS